MITIADDKGKKVNVDISLYDLHSFVKLAQNILLARGEIGCSVNESLKAARRLRNALSTLDPKIDYFDV